MSLAFLIPYAHLGHWYVQLAFAVPSLLIIGFMWRDSRRRKRQGKRTPRAKRVPGKRAPPGTRVPPGKRVPPGSRVPPGDPVPPGEDKPGR